MTQEARDYDDEEQKEIEIGQIRLTQVAKVF